MSYVDLWTYPPMSSMKFSSPEEIKRALDSLPVNPREEGVTTLNPRIQCDSLGWVATHRAKKNYSIRTLSKMAGIADKTLYNIESGIGRTSLTVVIKLKKALGIYFEG
jgi:DNA-binding XRE family transcriptional regulator